MLRRLPWWGGWEEVLVPSPGRRRGLVGLLLWSGCGVVPEGKVRIARRRRGEWRASVVLPLRSLAACIGNEVEEVLGRDPVLQTSYRQYVES